MNTTNKTTEERVEELRNKYKLKDNTIYCSDDSEFCNDIRQALTQAHQQGEREGDKRAMDFMRRETDLYCKGENKSTEVRMLILDAVKGERERIKPFVERVRLDVEVMVCDCGEKYKDSDLDISVGDLEKALQQPLPDKE